MYKRYNWRNIAVSLVLCLISALMLSAALPPNNSELYAWIAFLPLLVVFRINKPFASAGWAILTMALVGTILSGRVETYIQFGNVFFAFVMLAVVVALTGIVASFTANRLSPVWWSILVPCAAVVFEYLSQNAFPVTVAISQYQTPGALRLVSYTGIWGVTYMLWFVPASLIGSAIGRRAAKIVFAFAFVALIAILSLRFPAVDSDVKRVTLAAVQATNPSSCADITAKTAGADVFIWPEHLMDMDNPLPYEAARERGGYVVASFKEVSDRSKPYNSVCLISPDGERVDKSRKIHLFGRESMKYIEGSRAVVVACDGFSAGMPICFDTVFTDVCRKLVRRGAKALFVPVSDPDVPSHIFQHIHAAVIPFRAAENGVPIAWAESVGMSMIVDQFGRVVAQIKPENNGVAQAEVALRSRSTFYNRAGDYFAYLCGFGMILGVVKRQKRSNTEGNLFS